jgi:hypothetical protein
VSGKLRGIAMIAGLLAVGMGAVAVMPGRLVMYRGFRLFADDYVHDFSTISAGGLIGALHAAALAVLAFRLWHKPTTERAWWFVVAAPVLELLVRVIDAVIWRGYARWPNVTGRIYDGLVLTELAIAIVVLPLALYLGRRTGDAPQARVVSD